MADKGGGEGKKPLGRAIESLGWLASSGVQPKRRREIAGALPLPMACSLQLLLLLLLASFSAVSAVNHHSIPVPHLTCCAGVGAASLVALQVRQRPSARLICARRWPRLSCCPAAGNPYCLHCGRRCSKAASRAAQAFRLLLLTCG